jgi:hypothetical protein
MSLLAGITLRTAFLHVCNVRLVKLPRAFRDIGVPSGSQ